MRVLIMSDMEGVSQIADHRECWPAFPEYWRAGRDKYTADIVAAASGLLEGGASAVGIADSHGSGYWRNIRLAELPDRVEMVRGEPAYGTFDASFQLGMHARCGAADGFMSHTHLPGLRLAVDGALITESHEEAWSAGSPLLGVTGDDALERKLGGALQGTPFLAVKRSTSRTNTTPRHASVESFDAMRAFARECALGWRDRATPRLPERFRLDISLDPDLIEYIRPEAGLTRESAAVVSVTGSDWLREGKPAIKAAFAAAMRPWIAALDGLKLISEDVMFQQNPEKLEHFRDYLTAWMQAQDESWRV